MVWSWIFIHLVLEDEILSQQVDLSFECATFASERKLFYDSSELKHKVRGHLIYYPIITVSWDIWYLLFSIIHKHQNMILCNFRNALLTQTFPLFVILLYRGTCTNIVIQNLFWFKPSYRKSQYLFINLQKYSNSVKYVTQTTEGKLW